MVYEVTYQDAKGNDLLTTTFNAEGPHQALSVLLQTPTLKPPDNTEYMLVRRITAT